MNEAKEFAFDAVIKQIQEGKGGSYVEFPFDTQDCFGTTGRVKVTCRFEDAVYRGSLVRMGTECHIVGITKEILTQIGKSPGESVHVRLRADTDERAVEISKWLSQALSERADLLKVYEGLSYTNKKEMNLALESAKQEATRQKRLKKIMGDLEARLDGRQA